MKNLSIEKLIIRLGVTLLFSYPLIYMSMKLTKNSNFIFIKETIVGFILILITFDIFSKGRVPDVFFKYLLIGITSIIIAMINYDDYIFFFVYYREFLVYPLAFIYLGSLYHKNCRNLILDAYYSLGFCVILLMVYSLILPQDSYGVTGRLTSFFAGEHAPAVVSLLYILIYLSTRRSSNLFSVDAPTVTAAIAVYMIFLTDSRFSIVSLMVLFFLQILIRKGKDRVILLFTMMLVVIFGYLFIDFSSISVRGYDYNFSARFEQYALARSLIEEHWFLGIGVDKYGKIGSLEKMYSLNGYSTITMDSTIIKYTVNTGIPLIIIWLFFLLSPIFFRSRKKRYLVTSIYHYLIIIALVTGLVTGKLGSFPLNMYVFLFLGFSYQEIQPTRRSNVKSV